MFKLFALLAAICLACIGVASSTMAAGVGQLGFTLSQTDMADGVQLTLRDGRRSGMHSSSSYHAGELAGLNTDALRTGSGAIGFALVREAGRVDCRGAAQRAGEATGQCAFTADPRFAALLAFKALDISPAYVAALGREGYGRVPASDLIQLKALGVTPEFIRSLRAPQASRLSADELIRLKVARLMP